MYRLGKPECIMQSFDLYTAIGMVEMGGNVLAVTADYKSSSCKVTKLQLVPDVLMALIWPCVVHMRAWVEESLSRITDSEKWRICFRIVLTHLKSRVIADVALSKSYCLYVTNGKRLLHALYGVFIV